MGWNSCGKYARIDLMSSIYSFLKLVFSTDLIAPVVLILVYIAVFIFIRGSVPTSEEIVAHFASIYQRYGYEVIFLGAALEALVLINFAVPGSIAVGLGAVFARSGEVDLTSVVLVATLGATLGYIVDYLLGYFGFGKVVKKLGYFNVFQSVKAQIETSGVRTFILGFVHPNIGSLVSLTAGVIKMRFLSFITLSFLATVAWVSFWALIIFALGDVFLLILTRYTFVLLLMVISIWLLIILYGRRKS